MMKAISGILAVMLLSPGQLAAVVMLSILFVALVAGNVWLFLYLRRRGERKLCTHQLQSKRDELLNQLDLLRSGEFVDFGDETDEDEDDEADMLIVDDDEDEDSDDAPAQTQKNNLGVVTREEVDETMDADILYVSKISAEAREKLGFAGAQYDKKRYYVRYSQGFEAKLRMSSDEVKERYAAIMNEIALYKDVKVKSSYRQQRIFKGRKTLGLLVFCGKTLCIALALNPSDYEETKFKGIDKSDRRRYKKTPMLMKLSSARRLEYAKYLLVQVAEENTILLNDTVEQVTYDVAEKTRDELYVEGKIQITVLGEVPDSVPYEQDDAYDEDEDDDEDSANVEERKLYNRSYAARIIQADDELKARYSEIKNHIVSYRGVFNGITWKREAFYVGKRECFATFAVRGKTLCLFLAEQPQRFDDTKYKVEDRTKQVRNAKMPTMFRIKSDRGTKYAKELIDIVLTQKGVKVNEEYKPVNYRPVYKSTDNLIRNGYIRVRTTQVLVEEGKSKKTVKKPPQKKTASKAKKQ